MTDHTLGSEDTVSDNRTTDELQHSAEAGDLTAATLLGFRYLMGEDVEPNLRLAHKWILQAAQNGEATACVLLSHLYADGRGVSQDFTEAFRWSLTAARVGSLEGAFNVGAAYRFGQGVSQDFDSATQWLSAVATADTDSPLVAAAQFSLAVMLHDRDRGTAMDWLHAAAKRGHTQAQVNLAIAYWNGEGVRQDRSTAVKWLRQAAGQGDPKAHRTSSCVARRRGRFTRS